jgi:hypothetical protein
LENLSHLVTHPFLCILNNFFFWSFLLVFHITFEIDVSLQSIYKA